MNVRPPSPIRVRGLAATNIHWIAAVTALLGTLAYFLPLIGARDVSGSGWPGFMMSGDVQKGYFPAFVEGYRRFWAGGLLGIDFLTGAGASVFSFRANFMPLYPPALLLYLFFDVSNLKTAAFAYCLLHVLHLAISLYVTVLLGRQFLRLTQPQSIALALFYGLSFQGAIYVTQLTFFVHMMFVPVLAYMLCLARSRRSLAVSIAVSPVFVVQFLGSYGPLMVGALVAGIGVAAIAFLLDEDSDWSSLLYPTASLTLAGACVLPYYIAQLQFTSEAAPQYLSVQTIAHELAFSGRDFLAGLSQFIKAGVSTHTEGRLNWGLIPSGIILAGLVLLALKGPAVPRRTANLFLVSLAVYLPFLLVSLGASVPASDMFYYGVPVLGRMHDYGRFLMFAQFFLAIAVVCAGQIIIEQTSDRGRALLVLGSVSLWLLGTALIASSSEPDRLVTSGPFLVELFLLFATMACLAIWRSQAAIIPAAIMAALIGLTPMYAIQRSAGSARVWDHEIGYQSPQFEAFVGFVETHGRGKSLLKVLNLSDEIGPYIYRNFPWLVGSRVKMMSFQGYETHLAMIRDYFSLMGGHYGQYDRSWVIGSGLDFILWTDASAHKIPALLGSTHELAAQLMIKPGVHVAKVQRKPGAQDKPELLLLSPETASSWPTPLANTGWSVIDGQLSPTQSPVRNIGFPLRLYPGSTYEMSMTVKDATAGLIVPALGGQIGAPHLSGTGTTITRRYTGVSGNDAWIGASADFNGTISDVRVTEVLTAPPLPSLILDDGLIRIEGARKGVSTATVSSDHARYVEARIAANAEVRVTYLLWPNRYMRPYLDGRRVPWERDGVRPASIRIPPGNHVFTVRFESRWGRILTITAAAYAALLLLTLLVATWRATGRARPRWLRMPGSSGRA